MAQLRDSKTSQVIFEGTPFEVAQMAEQIGAKEVLFDDVGSGFDHKAVLSADAQNQDQLKSITDKESKKWADNQIQKKKKLLQDLKKAQSDVEDALNAARANLE